MSVAVLLVVGWCLAAMPGRAIAGEAWEPVALGASDVPVLAVAAHERQPHRLLAATARRVYQSADGGQSWREDFRAPGTASITSVALNGREPPALLVATTRGLYRSEQSGRWGRVWRGIGEDRGACTVVRFSPNDDATALAGTPDGVLISRDGGRRWRRLRGPAGDDPVVDLAFDPTVPERAYVLTEEGVFIGWLAEDVWQQRPGRAGLSGAGPAQAQEPGEPSEQDADTEPDALDAPRGQLRRLAVDPTQPARLYAATPRGVWLTEDEGMTWRPLTDAGLPSAHVTTVLPLARSPVVLYAGTDRGVARHEPGAERWEPLPAGLSPVAVHELAATRRALWAAAADGLYRYSPPPELTGSDPLFAARELLGNFSHEPSIARVQQAAIAYAEVHPDKIARWRRQAALKALLPELSVGWDRDTNRNLRVDEGTFPHFQIIDTEDRNAGLDVSISWDLGGLLWNDDQTSIDVRSKLMVQLRDEVLDEVTRAYFERRRLQVALLTDPPADPQRLTERELRIQELTAVLDGLTGGDFSRHLTVQSN